MFKPMLRRRKIISALIAGILALGGIGAGIGLSLTHSPNAHAATGTGVVVGGGPAVAGWDNTPVLYVFDDRVPRKAQGLDPTQGWEAASIEYFRSQMDAAVQGAGMKAFSPTTNAKFAAACNAALAKANQRDPSAGKARVVAAFLVYDKGLGWTSRGQEFLDKVWKSQVGNLEGWDGNPDLSSLYTEFYRDAGTPQMSIVCGAANAHEPEDPNYNLNVTTDKASVFTQAGSTESIADMVHASNSQNISESLSANIVVNGALPDGQSVQQVKAFTMTSVGDTRSPEFVPGDFGWDSWPAGSFWFDVVVPQQGEMAVAVDTPDRDPRESWTADMDRSPVKELFSAGTTIPVADLVAGQVYDARIRFHSNGASQLVAHDLIFTDEVFVGSQNADDTSAVRVLDPSGNPVNAQVEIHRDGQSVDVTVTVTGITNQGYYTLVVPTFVKPTGVDFTVEDQPTVCWYAAPQCFNSDVKHVYKKSPRVDKAWVLNEAGALVTADLDHTNNVGADTMTFAPGSQIASVVNVTVPKNIDYQPDVVEVYDDWSAGTPYMVFQPENVSVYVDGVNRSDQFDISVEDGVTRARMNDDLRASLVRKSTETSIKLVQTGMMKNDYEENPADSRHLDEIVNRGGIRINNEDKPSNTPSVFTTTPDPDKVWVLDETGALRTADESWTNREGADEKVFMKGEQVYSVVNGRIPAHLAENLSAYSITDDWSNGLDYIDLSNTETYKVFVGGQEVTSQFTFSVEDGVSTAVARPEFLATTANRATTDTVKFMIGGAFKTDYNLHGATVKIINTGSETWNNRSEETNVPAIYTWTPDPVKDVKGSAEQAGDKTFESINGLSVMPGQKLEYSISVDLRVPENTARGIHSLGVRDSYDRMFIPDKTSVELWDMRSGTLIPAKNYTVSFDDANHQFTLMFSEEWIKKNITDEGVNWEWIRDGYLYVRFTGTVSADLGLGGSVNNQAFQIINNVETETTIPTVSIPSIEPDKKVLATDERDIDGKTLLVGDKLVYRLCLDGGPSKDQMAYFVHKLGLIDDFDETKLALGVSDVQVVD